MSGDCCERSDSPAWWPEGGEDKRKPFWKVWTVAAVLLAAAYAARPLWAPAGAACSPYADAGGGIGNMIAYAGLNEKDGKVYVVDTQAKVILVYGPTTGVSSFQLLAGRSYAADGTSCVKNAWPYNQGPKGIPISETTQQAIRK